MIRVELSEKRGGILLHFQFTNKIGKRSAKKFFSLLPSILHRIQTNHYFFFEENPGAGYVQRGELSTLYTLLGWLRNNNITRKTTRCVDENKIHCIEHDFIRHLDKERGLSPATLNNYIPPVKSFLTEHFGSGPIVLIQYVLPMSRNLSFGMHAPKVRALLS